MSEEADIAPEQDSAERFPRRSARRARTRARILEAASTEFKKAGYAEATMNAIAEAADIHVTTLFTHFKTKRDLAAALSDQEIDQFRELIDAAKGKVPFFDFFRQLVLTTAATRQKDGDPKTGLTQEVQRDPELALSWLRYEETEVRLVAEYIAHDYGLDAKEDYTPYLAGQVLIASGVTSYTRWVRTKGADLVKETETALDLAERMARSILPAHPVKR
ncbi:TetR/AcrR family transcriptional regulator [Sphingopyxis sp. J-6]|uniref:TetR family transcriptional regulator n=1 Tax=Sphingopyxis sp. J-6 TaxID=3122054 RepID=UPI0039842697